MTREIFDEATAEYPGYLLAIYASASIYSRNSSFI